jgi:hypothetical protein
MRNKIGLVVESKTDKKFFDEYFKKEFNLRNMIVLPSSTKDNCKIMNPRAIKSKIEDLEDKNCTEIYILLDLDTKCEKEVYHCILELKNDYIKKMNLEDNINVIVVSKEIEAWLLSAYKNSDNKSKEDLKKELNIKSNNRLETTLLKKFIASKRQINRANNKSLDYFLNKLEL